MINRRHILTGIAAAAAVAGLSPAPALRALSLPGSTTPILTGCAAFDQIFAELIRAYTEIYGQEPMPGTVLHKFIEELASSMVLSLETQSAMIRTFDADPLITSGERLGSLATMYGVEPRQIGETDAVFRDRFPGGISRPSYTEDDNP